MWQNRAGRFARDGLAAGQGSVGAQSELALDGVGGTVAELAAAELGESVPAGEGSSTRRAITTTPEELAAKLRGEEPAA